MAEKTLTLIGQMDKVWMDAIEEFDDGAPGCEVDLHVRLAVMEGVLRFVKAQRPKTTEWPLGIVTAEGLARASDVIRGAIESARKGIKTQGFAEATAQSALVAAGIRTVQETIEGVYHSEDASGTDRIVKDWSGCVFLDISDEYDGKRIAVHIEVLED